MQLNVLQRVGRIRWIFLPLGMCALVAVGAHAAADVVGDRVLWLVDRVDAFFDAIFSSWSVTAPLVDLVRISPPSARCWRCWCSPFPAPHSDRWSTPTRKAAQSRSASSERLCSRR